MTYARLRRGLLLLFCLNVLQLVYINRNKKQQPWKASFRRHYVVHIYYNIFSTAITLSAVTMYSVNARHDCPMALLIKFKSSMI
jgi:hypothetical protein